MKKKLRLFSQIFLLCLLGSYSKAQSIYNFAGNGTAGFTNGSGAAITGELNHPWGLATDRAGNLYIADEINSSVRKVSASGIISIYAGSGGYGYSGDGGSATCGCSMMGRPTGVAVDAAGNVYIADSAFNCIRMVSPSNIIYTVAGSRTPGYSGDGGPATAATLNAPTGLAFDDSGNLYIADFGNNVIRRMTPTGIISTFAGTGAAGYTGDGGSAAAATFSNPINVVLDASGNIYVADYSNNVVRKINRSGIISTFAGTGVSGFGGDGSAAIAAMFAGPVGIAFDGAGNTYITDQNNNRIRKVNTSGIITTIAGNGLAGYAGNGGPEINAEFYSPKGLLIDRNGNQYISDYINNVIRIVSSGALSFVNRSSDTLGACQATSLRLDSALAITDTTSGQTETWTILSGPSHGLLSGFATTAISNGSVLIPSGLTYRSIGSYSGIDTFSIQVSNGISVAAITLHIMVNPTPVVAATANQILCNGSTTTPINFSGTGNTYVWTNSNSTIGLASTGTGNIAAFTGTDVTGNPVTGTILVTPIANGCAGTARSFTITVNPTPDVAQPANQSVCNGNSTNAVAFTSNVPGASFTWTNSNTATGIPASGTGNIEPYIIANLTNAPALSIISVSVSANGCNGSVQSFTITANPVPNVSAISNQTLCSGQATNPVNFSGSVTGTDFSWTNNDTGIGMAASGTGNIPSFTSVNNTSGQIAATIYVTPVFNGCPGLQQQFTIMVNAAPPVPVITLNESSVCTDVYFQNFGAATLAPAGMAYSWSAANAMLSEVGSTGQYALVNFKNTGDATVNLTTTILSTGCQTTTGYNINVGATVADAPAGVAYFNSSFICLQNNETAYQWGYDDASTLAPTIITGEINQDYVIQNPDLADKNYWVKVTDNGCVQKTYYNRPASSAMKQAMTEVTVYPNPAGNNIQVNINTTVAGSIQMEVLNMTGQNLYTTTITNNIAAVNVSGFGAGCYLVNCYRDGAKISSTRFIKN